MKHKRTVFTARVLRSIALGTFCAIGAFAVGIETAGDVHPFTRSEAAIQEIVAGSAALAGDVDGNGTLDASDAYKMLQALQGVWIPQKEELVRGDMNADGEWTEADLQAILRTLSLQ